MIHGHTYIKFGQEIRVARGRRFRETHLKVENNINLSGGKNDVGLFEVLICTLECK